MTAPSASSLLDYYHCTFFLPLLGLPDNFPVPAAHLEAKVYSPGASEKENDAQAFHFFTPTLRSVLFDQGNVPMVGNRETDKHSDLTRLIPLREWRLPDDEFADWRMELLPNSSQLKDMRAGKLELALAYQIVTFRSIRLFRYFNGIYLLAFTVEPALLSQYQREIAPYREQLRGENQALPADKRKSDEDIKKEANKVVSLFGGDGQYLDDYRGDARYTEYAQLQSEAWLRFTRLGRQLFASFTEQAEEGKIAKLKLFCGDASPVVALDKGMCNPDDSCDLPHQSGDMLSPIVVALIQSFFQQDISVDLKQHIRLFDDRMFVSVAYGLAGSGYDDLHRVRTLVAMTDRFADCWVKGYPYTQAVLKRMMQDTEFDLWADAGAYSVFNDMVNGYINRGGFFRDTIAPKHIPYLYDRMLVQALFYQASLRHYDEQITLSTSGLLSSKEKDKAIIAIRKQRAEFIRFTNQYWFRELTNQMQGKEIFRLQQQGLGLGVYYQQIQDEIAHTNEYLQTLHDSWVASGSNRIGKVAALLAVVAALPVFNDIFKNETGSMWSAVNSWLVYTFPITADVAKMGLAGGLALLMAVLFFYFLRSKD